MTEPTTQDKIKEMISNEVLVGVGVDEIGSDTCKCGGWTVHQAIDEINDCTAVARWADVYYSDCCNGRRRRVV